MHVDLNNLSLPCEHQKSMNILLLYCYLRHMSWLWFKKLSHSSRVYTKWHESKRSRSFKNRRSYRDDAATVKPWKYWKKKSQTHENFALLINIMKLDRQKDFFIPTSSIECIHTQFLLLNDVFNDTFCVHVGINTFLILIIIA